jgi:hypothetical protein
MTLSVLAAQKSEAFDGFGIFAIVKETGIDDEGLAEFHTSYFRYPTFCDKTYSFYQALGDRKVILSLSLVFNPLSLLTVLCDSYKRITNKGIQGNFKGEGLVQGGIIIFDKGGKPRYAYEEETGKDLPVKDILAAVHAVRRETEAN